MSVNKVIIACAGGFLGAGKTTALVAAARELLRRGLRVGVITNDQGDALVDTEVMRGFGLPAEEITGGCFCCKFDELVGHARRLLDQAQPDVILAEAVGSCTDLAATVYQPLRRYYADQFDLAPLSVFVEPSRLRAFYGGAAEFPETIAYLFRKQLQEADLVILNKQDTVTNAERDELNRMLSALLDSVPLHSMSAATGQGIAEWVDALLGAGGADERVLEIDYDTYARAEAALGWLNATVDVTATDDFSPRSMAERLITEVQSRCASMSAPIAHVKVLVVTKDGCDRIAITNNPDAPQWSGEAELAFTREASLIVNARVQTRPEELTRLIEESIADTAGEFKLTASVQHMESFSPPPPRPRFRFASCFSPAPLGAQCL